MADIHRTATDYVWSITYGGDEPISHPFYRKVLDAVMLLSVKEGIEVIINMHNATWVDRCRVVYYQPHSDHICVREVETGRVHAIMVEDIHNVHIC